jgi:2-oxoglutarate dehydrogenase E1 component
VRDIVFGMAHRGRLNVLAQVLGKPHRALFHEFKGGSFAPDEVEGSGDVKYHLGASSDREFDGNKVHLSLTANPSHLEIVDPVVLGKARAKQDQRGDVERTQVLPLLLHGDAAFAGQGVVAECLGLSGLKGTAPAARSTSSSTTRSASPRTRAIRAPRPTRPTSPR